MDDVCDPAPTAGVKINGVVDLFVPRARNESENRKTAKEDSRRETPRGIISYGKPATLRLVGGSVVVAAAAAAAYYIDYFPGHISCRPMS